MATSRYMGLLAGPALGAVFLLAFGPFYGLMINAALYRRFCCGCGRRPTARGSASASNRGRAPIRGFADIIETARAISSNRIIVSMVLLPAPPRSSSRNAYQAQMPEFGRDLGHGDPDVSYSALLGADAAGALTAGLVLESRGLLQPNARSAFILAMLWCCAIAAFAMSTSYYFALVVLFAAGFLELSFYSMAQSLVQLHAPAPIRGRVIGLYSVAALGLRTFSGITIGIAGGFIGIHWSLSHQRDRSSHHPRRAVRRARASARNARGKQLVRREYPKRM